MTESHPRSIKVLVRFKKREDGGLQALCEEVPGFYLSSIDRRAVMADVVPALELLLKVNHGVNVEASPLGYGLYQLAELTTDVPNEIPEPEFVQEYVLRKAA